MKEEDSRTTRTSRAAGRSTSPLKIVSPSGTTVLRNLRGRMEQRRRLLEKRKGGTPKLKRSAESTSADTKVTPSSEQVVRETEVEMESTAEDSAASATTVRTRSKSPSSPALDGTSIAAATSDAAAEKPVATTTRVALPNLTIQKPSPSIVPVKQTHVLRSRGTTPVMDKSSPKTGNAPITLKLNLRARGVSPDVSAAPSAVKSSHRLSSAAASPESSSLVNQSKSSSLVNQSKSSSLVNQSKQGTTKTASIRTRLSTGSIQMNGTTTISSAKEKAEMEVIMKQIAKAENTTSAHRASPGNKKRLSAPSTSDARGTSDHPPPKKRKIGRNDGSGEDNRNDYFCWLCHKEGTVVCCELCSRVYHTRCLGLTGDLPQDWVCPECEKVMRAECIDTQSKSMKMLTLEQLCKLLRYALERMKHAGSEPFQTAVDMAAVPSYSDYIFYPMDLTTLEKNVKKKLYGCTEAFLSDAKWIQHNCTIYNGAHHKLTNSAKMIIKICKHEMNEIELCPDCYLNSCLRAEDWFSELCRVPHTLVWAKLKGYPFWPSKALREMDKHVDVRFFGAHDRSWVPVSQCFLLSKNMPTSLQKGKKNAGLDGAMDELNKHVEKLRDKFGSYEYAPFRTPYDKTDCYKPVNLKPVHAAARQKIVAKQASFFTSQKSISGTVKKSAVSKTASALKSKYSAMVTLKKGVDQLEYPRLGVKLYPIDLKREGNYEHKKDYEKNRTAVSAEIGNNKIKVECTESDNRTNGKETVNMEISAEPDLDTNDNSDILDETVGPPGISLKDLKDHDVDSSVGSASSGDTLTLQKKPNKPRNIVDTLAQKMQAFSEIDDQSDEMEINDKQTETGVRATSDGASAKSDTCTVSGPVENQSKAVEHFSSEKDQESCVNEDKSDQKATEELSGGSVGKASVPVSSAVSQPKLREVAETEIAESKSETNTEIKDAEIGTEVKKSETNNEVKQSAVQNSETITVVKKSETINEVKNTEVNTEVKNSETNNENEIKQSEIDTAVKKSETITEVKKSETNESYRKMLESTIQNCKAKLGMEIPEDGSEADMSESGEEDVENVSEESASSSESESEFENQNDTVDGKDSGDEMDATEVGDVDDGVDGEDIGDEMEVGDEDGASEKKAVKETDTEEISDILKEISDVIDGSKSTKPGESSSKKDELDKDELGNRTSLDTKSDDKGSVDTLDGTKDILTKLSSKDQTNQNDTKSDAQPTEIDHSVSQKESNDAKRDGSCDDSVKDSEENKQAVLNDVTGLLMDCDTIEDDDSDIEQLVIDMDAESCDQSEQYDPSEPTKSPDTFCVKGGDIRNNMDFSKSISPPKKLANTNKNSLVCSGVELDKHVETETVVNTTKSFDVSNVSTSNVLMKTKKAKSPAKTLVGRETVSSTESGRKSVPDRMPELSRRLSGESRGVVAKGSTLSGESRGVVAKVSALSGESRGVVAKGSTVMEDVSQVDLTADSDTAADSDVSVGIDIGCCDEVTKAASAGKETPASKVSSLTAKADKISEKFTKMLATMKQTFDDTYTEMVKECSSTSLTDTELTELLDETNWKHQSEIQELKHNFHLTVEELKTSWEADRYGWDAKRVCLETEKDALTSKYAKELEAVTRETKKKQWCAYCQKEAMYYCCWNTSYCNYPCQQKHWAQHMEHCLQSNKSGNQSGTTATATSAATSKTSKPGPGTNTGWPKSGQVLPARTVEASIADPTIASTIKMVQATVTPIASSSALKTSRSQLQDRIDIAIQREEARRGEGRASVSGLKYVPMSSPKSMVHNIGSVSATPATLTTNLMYNPLSSPSPLSRQPQAATGMMQPVPRGMYINQQIPVQQRLPHPGAHRPMGSQMVLPQSLLQQAIYPVQVPQQQIGGTILFQNQQQQNIMGYGMPPRGPY